MATQLLRLADAGDPAFAAADLCFLRPADRRLDLPPLYVGFGGLSAYFAEIFRGGNQAIDRGQFEAAKVLQLTYGQTLRKIVIPQVIKIVLPSIGNEVINLVKDSSLVYVIGLGDLLRAGNLATARDVTLVPLVLVALIYLLLIGLCTLLLRQLEKHYSYYR